MRETKQQAEYLSLNILLPPPINWATEQPWDHLPRIWILVLDC